MRRSLIRRFFAIAALPLALAACDSQPPPPEAVETEVPDDLPTGDAAGAAPQASGQQDPDASADVARAAEIGSPMEDRVATLGLLNKRNNVSQDIELSPGESRRIGDIIVRLSACERTAPWEMPRETGAFVQVLVQSGDDEQWQRIFSGWLFKQSPSLNVVEHPVYDVWVKDCAMSFPGEEPDASDDSSSSEA